MLRGPVRSARSSRRRTLDLPEVPREPQLCQFAAAELLGFGARFGIDSAGGGDGAGVGIEKAEFEGHVGAPLVLARPV